MTEKTAIGSLAGEGPSAPCHRYFEPLGTVSGRSHTINGTDQGDRLSRALGRWKQPDDLSADGYSNNMLEIGRGSNLLLDGAGDDAVISHWAVLGRLANTAIASGEIDVSADRLSLQHLEGGIVSEILVADGDLVQPGQVLLRLDRTQPLAVYERLRSRHYALLAREARLLAERDCEAQIDFREILNDPTFADKALQLRKREEQLFHTHRQTLDQQAGITGQSIRQLEEEIRSLEREIASQERQINLLLDESASIQSMYERKVTDRQQMLVLQRETAELQGLRSRNRAAIARAQQSISEKKIRLIDMQTQWNTEILAELRDLQGDILEFGERVTAAEDVLRRTEIRAPIKGTIVDVAVSTRGVVASRQPLMDIVPVDEQLLVKARLEPRDIDVVRQGQPAFIRLAAYNQSNRQPLEGRVTSISADCVKDDSTGISYYLASISLPAIVDTNYADSEIFPGMQAEVMIQVGARSPLDYLFQPLLDGMNHALQED